MTLSSAAQLIPYALIAALSPLGVAATLTVMRTGRLQAFGFALGVVVGQLLACAVLVVLGAATTTGRTKAHPTFQGLLALGLGIALLLLAVVIRRHPESLKRQSSGRSHAALDRLQRVHVLTASGLGLLLGIGGPKRLVLTALASASIAAAGITGSAEVELVVWYGLLATVLVWLPVIAYLILGDLVTAGLDSALEWLARQRSTVTVYALVVVGLALLVNAVVLL
jgi:Sap, sulfolipid-1-addressing protein